MTHISTKIGRFICDASVEIGSSKAFSRKFRCNEEVDDEEEEEEDDDVMLPSRTHSSSDLRNCFGVPRKFSCPDFQVRGFECSDLELGVGTEGEGEHDDPTGSDVLPWRDDYNRTLCPYGNDRILNLLSRVFRLSDSGIRDGDESSPDGRDGEPEAEDFESHVIPLPWRSKEAMSALEDASNHLWESAGGIDEATPQVKDEDEGHPLASFRQSSSPSGSSFQNIRSFDDEPRPDLSVCHSFSLSHWLSEAESRHSEPFCQVHHHLASPGEPSSMRSSATGHPHDLPRPRRRRPFRDHPHSGSSSSSSSSSGHPFPSFIPDEEEEVGERDQVLKWLMMNDLEVTANLDQADDQSLESCGRLDL